MLQRDGGRKIGSLEKPQGGHTTKAEETQALLLETHFPGCVTIPAVEIQKQPEIPTYRASRDDWKLAGKIITSARLVWAIRSFKPYKAAGPDEIFPALLQKGLKNLQGLLINLFRASIALEYVPRCWRQARVVFIPKPGRDSYAQVKSYRALSLTSFLLKTLEKLIDRHIREDVLENNPLHPNQYAYQTGKSCEEAIHELTSRAEAALENKEIMLATFVDTEGAYDNTSFVSIVQAMERRGVGRCVVRWTNSSLRHRMVKTTLGEVTREAVIMRGCPQGGFLSPLMWSLVIDGLLCELQRKGFYAQGYADDLAILVNGKFGLVVSGMMQQALNTVENWCRKEGLTTNPNKTSVVAFTRRRNLDLKGLSMWGCNIEVGKEVK